MGKEWSKLEIVFVDIDYLNIGINLALNASSILSKNQIG